MSTFIDISAEGITFTFWKCRKCINRLGAISYKFKERRKFLFWSTSCCKQCSHVVQNVKVSIGKLVTDTVSTVLCRCCKICEACTRRLSVGAQWLHLYQGPNMQSYRLLALLWKSSVKMSWALQNGVWACDCYCWPQSCAWGREDSLEGIHGWLEGAAGD